MVKRLPNAAEIPKKLVVFNVIETRGFKEASILDAQFLDVSIHEPEVIQRMGDNNGREHGHQQSQHQTDAEPFHRPRAKLEKKNSGDDGGKVSVQDSGKRLIIPLFHHHARALSETTLLAHPLKDKDVGVDGHPDG